jgi:phosphonate transport system substrate-binding protein
MCAFLETSALPKLLLLLLRFFFFSGITLLPCALAATAQGAVPEQPPAFYFAVSAMASPTQTSVNFSNLERYLAIKLETPVTLKQRRTYQEINELLLKNKVQMAFTCTGGYLAGRKLFDLELLVVPVMKGTTHYQSYIVVQKANPARSLEDLRGTVFAFTDPLSLSGKLYPTARINRMGTTTNAFFRRTFYTESHDKSIEAVATGLANAAAVDSLIFDALTGQPGSFADQLKVIERSEAFGMPPVVVPPGLPAELRLKLLRVLLAMDKDPEGQKVLKSLGMDGFALPEPELYRSAILLQKEINE